jgi:hypothetical protein
MAIIGMGRVGIRSIAAPAPTPTYPTSLKLFIDAGNPASYPGSGTTWTDLSGNGNNGTLVNGTSYSPSNGGIFTLDGINDYVATPLYSSVSGMAGVFWVKFNTLPVTDIPLLIDAGQGYIGFVLNAALKIKFLNFSSTTATGSTTINLGQWYCVGFSFKTGQTSKVYVNGVLDGSSSSIQSNIQNNSALLKIGTNGVQYLNSSLAVAQLYNDAITDDTFALVFNNFKSRYGH